MQPLRTLAKQELHSANVPCQHHHKTEVITIPNAAQHLAQTNQKIRGQGDSYSTYIPSHLI